MDFSNLTNENVVMCAMKCYDNPHAHGIKEFEEDFERFKYIKRLLKRYHSKGVIKERLVLNHIIILYNVFGDMTTRILFFKIDHSLYPALKTFLLFLNRMPDIVHGINGKDINSALIVSDHLLIKRLREARNNTL